jgi:peptidoglycan/LPS O-acetylase OafA/YrhL
LTPASGIEPGAPVPRAVTERRADIQGLRAVAVLLVAGGHAGIGFLGGGYVGVDVFFVLSGFLITGLLLSGARKRGYVSAADFYARRARRILPAATLTLIATSVASYYLLNAVRAKQYLIDSAFAAVFGANVRFSELGTDYFAQTSPPSPVQHYWSLSIEEQFYLLWPALIALLLGVSLWRRSGASRRRSGVASSSRLLAGVGAVAAASLAFSVVHTAADPVASYFSTLSRVWELALGALLAIAAPRLLGLAVRWRLAAAWGGLACIVVAAVTFSETTSFPGYAALLPTVGTALLIAAGIGSRAPFSANRLLEARPLTYVGDRSYAFYLWHWPVLIIAAQYEGHALSVPTNLLLLAGAFALSVVSYRFVEDPIRRGDLRLPPARVLSPALAVAAAILFALACVAVAREADVDLSALWLVGLLAAAIAFGLAARAVLARPLMTLKPGSPAAGLLLWPLMVGAVVFVSGFYLAAIRDAESDAATAAAAAPAPAAIGAPGKAGATPPEVTEAVAAADAGEPLPTALEPPVGELLDDRFAFESGCAPQPEETSAEICPLGDTAAERTLVVFGDSKAQMWMTAVVEMAERDGWQVLPLVKSACSPSGWAGWSPEEVGPYCPQWYEWAVARVQELEPDALMIAGSHGQYTANPPYNDASIEGMRMLVGATRQHTDAIVIFGDVPGFEGEPVDCLLAPEATMASCTTTLTDFQLASSAGIAADAEAAGIGYVEPRQWLCVADRCPMVIDETIAYSDHGHLSETYIERLHGLFRSAFRRELEAQGMRSPAPAAP